MEKIELYEKILKLIVKKNLVAEYKIRLKEMADTVFDGWGHYGYPSNVVQMEKKKLRRKR